MSISASVVLIIVRAILTNRGRVDEILSQSKADEGLPFAVPPRTKDRDLYVDQMVAYFSTPNGKAVLELQGHLAEFTQAKDDLSSKAFITNSIRSCVDLYFEAALIDPRLLVEPTSDTEDASKKLLNAASTGPSEEFRIAYYVVESDRLSRNNPTTRIALATADTLLDTLAGNASLFLKDEVTAKIVETAIEEFSQNIGESESFDGDVEIIFRRLLGAVAVAAAREGDSISDNTAVRALFGAVRSAEEELGANDVANLIGAAGLQSTVAALMTTVAADPSFVTSDKNLQASISAVLVKVSTDLPYFLGGKQEAVLSLVEALVSEAAKNATTVLSQSSGSVTLAEKILGAMLGNVQEAAANNSFFESVANGKLLGDFYKSTLSAVAANPEVIQGQINVDLYVANLISGYAEVLQNVDVNIFEDRIAGQAFATRILSVTLSSLADHPGLGKRASEFGPVMVSAMLSATADLIKDGLQEQDLFHFIDDVVAASTENVALINAGEHFTSVVAIWANVLSAPGIKALATPTTRLQILRTGAMSMVQNPVLWKKLDADGETQQLITDIVSALIEPDTDAVLSGPVLEQVIDKVLAVLTRNVEQANQLSEGVLSTALKAAVIAIKEDGALVCGLDDAAGYIANFLMSVLENPEILDQQELIEAVLKKALREQLNKVV